MAEVVATRRVPGKPTGIQTIPKTRGVVSRWVEPTAWSDGSVDDFTEDTVQRYDVELWRAGAKVDDARVKGNRKFWPMTKAEAQLTGYSTKVWAVGVDGDALDADPPAGSATPEDVTLGNLSGSLSDIAGTVSKPQMGSLGISRFGSTASMNAAAAVDGDIWINTSFSPTRVYRRVSGAWVYQVSGAILQVGTVVADGIVAGAIDGETITGVTVVASIFRTSGSNPKIEMIDSVPDTIRFINSIGTLRGEIKLLTGDVLGIASAVAFKTDSGIPMGIGNFSGSGANAGNYLEFQTAGSGTSVGTPSAGRCRLYYSAVSPARLLAVNADGFVREVANFT